MFLQDALELEHNRLLLPLIHMANSIQGHVRRIMHRGDPIDHVP